METRENTGKMVIVLPPKEWGFGKEVREVKKSRDEIVYVREEVREKYGFIGVLKWSGNLTPRRDFHW